MQILHIAICVKVTDVERGASFTAALIWVSQFWYPLEPVYLDKSQFVGCWKSEELVPEWALALNQHLGCPGRKWSWDAFRLHASFPNPVQVLIWVLVSGNWVNPWSPLVVKLYVKYGIKFDVFASKINCQHINTILYSSYLRRAASVGSCRIVVLVFVSLPCAEDPGIGMCGSSVRMWVIWELANTAVVSTGPRLWFKNRIQTDIIIQLHLAHWGPGICNTQTQTLTHRSTFHPTQ